MPFFIIFLLCLLSRPIAAEQLTTVNTHWPPWRVLEDNGHLNGIEIDILKNLSTRLKLQLVTKGCGWNRCLKYMRVGQSDVMTGLYKTPERETYMKFIEPPYRAEHGTCFYQTQTQSIEINSYQDLQNLTIGVVKKVAYFEQFDADNSIKKHQATTDEDLFRLLQGQRIDAMVMACATGDNYFKRLDLNGHIKRAHYVHRVARPVYLAISKQSPLLTRESEFSQALHNMLSEGEIQQIMSNYGILE